MSSSKYIRDLVLEENEKSGRKLFQHDLCEDQFEFCLLSSTLWSYEFLLVVEIHRSRADDAWSRNMKCRIREKCREMSPDVKRKMTEKDNKLHALVFDMWEDDSNIMDLQEQEILDIFWLPWIDR